MVDRLRRRCTWAVPEPPACGGRSAAPRPKTSAGAAGRAVTGGNHAADQMEDAANDYPASRVETKRWRGRGPIVESSEHKVASVQPKLRDARPRDWHQPRHCHD